MDDLSRQILDSFMQRGGAANADDADKRDANPTERVPLDHPGKARHHDGLSLGSIGSGFVRGRFVPFSPLSSRLSSKEMDLKKIDAI